jgi:hypothetical protein
MFDLSLEVNDHNYCVTHNSPFPKDVCHLVPIDVQNDKCENRFNRGTAVMYLLIPNCLITSGYYYFHSLITWQGISNTVICMEVPMTVSFVRLIHKDVCHLVPIDVQNDKCENRFNRASNSRIGAAYLYIIVSNVIKFGLPWSW